MRQHNINPEAFIRLLLMNGFVFLFLYLWASGRMLNFIHPRMAIFVFIAAIIFLVLVVVQLPALAGPKSGSTGWWRQSAYLIFLLPLVLGFAYSGQALSADIGGRQGGLTAPVGLQSGADQSTAQTDQRIVFDEKTYAPQLMLMYSDLEDYLGREVELVGFVYHDDLFSEGEFAVARYVVTCCAADAQIVGLLCRFETAIAAGEWIRVTGLIEQGERDGAAVPVIAVEQMEIVPPLDSPYIYF